jgi:hypothetical protein
MTIKSAASALIDDLVASGSFLRNQVSACDYGMLGRPAAAGCAIMIQPNLSTRNLIAYGGVFESFWGITAECYIKDTSDTVETLTRVWDMHDAVACAIDGGTNTNTADRTARVTSFNRPRNVFVELGGNDFVPVFINIEVREDP